MDIVTTLLGLACISYAAWALNKSAIHYKMSWKKPMVAHPRAENPALYWFFLIMWAAIGLGILVAVVFG